jgi:hypothetical protein
LDGTRKKISKTVNSYNGTQLRNFLNISWAAGRGKLLSNGDIGLID